jgi:glutamate-1-semialdehyde aminotransferase
MIRSAARVRELQTTIAAGVIALEISNRNARVQALNDRWNELRSALQRLLRERRKDMAGVPGGQSGLLCREFKGKDGRNESTELIPA